MYWEDVPLHVLYSSGTTSTTTRETLTKVRSLKAIRPCGRDCVDYLAPRLFVVDINGQCKCCVDVPQDSVCEHSGVHRHVRAAEAGWSSGTERCSVPAGRTHCSCSKRCGSTTMPPWEAQTAFLELKSWNTFVPCANQKIHDWCSGPLFRIAVTQLLCGLCSLFLKL